jgi:hypothetical protein
MKKRTIFGLLILAAAVMTFGGCIWIFNNNPTVNLTSSHASWSYWGDDVFLDASASDEDGDSLSYKWYLDGEEQTQVEDELSITYAPQVEGSHTIRVTVSDGWGGSASDSITLEVYEGGYLQINNESTHTMYSVHVKRSSEDNWGPDHLFGDSIYAGTSEVILVPPYACDWWVNQSSSPQWLEDDDFVVGGTVSWDLDNFNTSTSLSPKVFGENVVRKTITDRPLKK